MFYRDVYMLYHFFVQPDNFSIEKKTFYYWISLFYKYHLVFSLYHYPHNYNYKSVLYKLANYRRTLVSTDFAYKHHFSINDNIPYHLSFFFFFMNEMSKLALGKLHAGYVSLTSRSIVSVAPLIQIRKNMFAHPSYNITSSSQSVTRFTLIFT